MEPVIAMMQALSDDRSIAGRAAAGRVALVIPTLNEEAAIGDVVRAIPRDMVGRTIVADGGSTDATVVRARDAGAEVIDAGRGYGRACLAAAKVAEGADIVAKCSSTATAPTIR